MFDSDSAGLRLIKPKYKTSEEWKIYAVRTGNLQPQEKVFRVPVDIFWFLLKFLEEGAGKDKTILKNLLINFINYTRTLKVIFEQKLFFSDWFFIDQLKSKYSDIF